MNQKSLRTRPCLSALITSIIALSPGLMLTSGLAADQCAAGVSGKFVESAPRDRFTFVNTSDTEWSVSRITIALASADGNLVFDTENGGLGVEVFQPYRLEASSAKVADVARPADGDQLIEIQFGEFPSGADYTFSIDVDDQLTQSSLGNIRVSGGELKGTGVTVEFVSETGATVTQESVFDAKNQTSVAAACT